MDLYPAIDLREGRCVRLYQGDFAAETTYSEDPVAVAVGYQAAGAPWLHVVDLDAALSGEPTNLACVADIAGAVEIPVQYGGGVRSPETAARLADVGVDRVVIGTAALENPDVAARIAARQPVALGLDVRGRTPATRGWLSVGGVDLRGALAILADLGAEAVVVTQIQRDGTLAGPDVGLLGEVLALAQTPVIASGGVGGLEHLTQLAALSVDGRSLAGVVVGRAIYEGAVDVAEAIAVLTASNSETGSA